MTKNILIFRSFSLVLLFLFTFSAGVARSADQQTALQKLESEKSSLSMQIQAKNEHLDCVGDGNCEVLPMGAKPCGGPSKYLVYSNSNSGWHDLKRLTESFTEVEKKINNAGSQMVGSCSTILAPEARCIKQKCAEVGGKTAEKLPN